MTINPYKKITVVRNTNEFCAVAAKYDVVTIDKLAAEAFRYPCCIVKYVNGQVKVNDLKTVSNVLLDVIKTAFNDNDEDRVSQEDFLEAIELLRAIQRIQWELTKQ